MSDLTQSTTELRISKHLLAYPTAIAAMQKHVAAVRSSDAGELVWLVEHPPLFTSGTSADPADLLNPDHFPTYAAGRGGQWTYHGPGQRTGYVMLDLTRTHGVVPPRDIKQFVWALEEWLIRALDRFNVRGERREGRVGVWIADRATGTDSKIAAIGVRVTRWVTWHGVALNVVPDLTHYGGIVPCGIHGHGVTSLHALGISATLEEADAALIAVWTDVFGSRLNQKLG